MNELLNNQSPLPIIAAANRGGRKFIISLMGDNHDPICLLCSTPTGNVVAHLFVRDGKVYYVSFGLFCDHYPADPDLKQLEQICKEHKDALLQMWIDKYILHRTITKKTI